LDEKQLLRVMLVDDNDLVRQGLASYLEGCDDIVLVAQVSGGEAAIQTCRRVLPDIVLMDIKMQPMDGIETTRRLKATCPNVKVLALTGTVDPDLIEAVFAAGAVGCIMKSRPMHDLPHLVRMVHEGQIVVAP
jgi:DNA-binding NarL/FixJ family response regulator